MTATSDVYELADPAELGLDPAKVAALVERAHREIDEGLLPSCQLALARHGRLAAFETIGAAEPGSRYVMFSMTKGITTAAIWMLVGEGALAWDTKAADIVPEFGTNGKDVITIEHLLTHTAGFPWAPLPIPEGATREGRCARFATWRLNWEPGSRFEYHPTSAGWVLGEVIERVSGTDFREFIHGRIFEPLGLTSFRLGIPVDAPEQATINELSAVGEYPTPEEVEALIGQKLDLKELLGEAATPFLLEFNHPKVRAAGAPAGGGLSNAADVALFYQGLHRNDRGLWNPQVIAEGIDPIIQFPDPMSGLPVNRSRGMMVAGEPPGSIQRGWGHGTSPRTYGHDGAGGQLAWVDPDSGVSFCYITNGIDDHLIRQARRGLGLNSRAANCVAS